MPVLFCKWSVFFLHTQYLYGCFPLLHFISSYPAYKLQGPPFWISYIKNSASVFTRSTNYTNRKIISTASMSLWASHFSFHFISFYLITHANAEITVWSQLSMQHIYIRTMNAKDLLIQPIGHLTVSVSSYSELSD